MLDCRLLEGTLYIFETFFLFLMASDFITSWQIDAEKVETVTDFIFLGSKITVNGDCSYEIKRCLLLGSYDKPRQCI